MDTIQPSNELERKLKTFNELEKKKIFENTFAVQLTQGCSIGCKDCGLGATKGVTDYIPYEFVKKIIENKNLATAKYSETPSFYFASEPFDYDFEGKNYLDVHKHYKKIWQNDPCVITSIPQGKEELIFNLLLKNLHSQRIIEAISLTKFNYNRIKNKFENIKFNEIDSSIQTFNPLKEIKRTLNPSFEEFLQLVSIHTQIRDFYKRKNMLRYKVGEENKYEFEQRRICNYSGVILTPKGAFNISPVEVTFENPIGQLITEITKENFKVNPLIDNLDYTY